MSVDDAKKDDTEASITHYDHDTPITILMFTINSTQHPEKYQQ